MAAAQRVLIVSEHPYPDHATLRRNVTQLLVAAVEVDLVCLAGANQPPSMAGLSTRLLHMTHKRTGALRYLQEYGLFWLWAMAVTFSLSIRHRYEAVLVDNPPDFLISVTWLARLRGARVVLQMLELTPELTAARLKLARTHAVVRISLWIERMATSWADEIITVSQQCADVLTDRGVDPRKIVIVPNTIPATRSAAAPKTGGRAPFIITHCSLVERYGVQVAIRAMALLGARWPELTLQVLGEGDHRAALEQQSRDLGLEGQIVFRGFLPWPDAMAEIRQAAVGIVAVIADGYGELLLPTKLLEYADNEVPVACANLPTIAHNFPADSLAYFEPGDAAGMAAQVDHLLRHPREAAAQARRAKSAMRGLSWEVVAPRYMAALGLEGAVPSGAAV